LTFAFDPDNDIVLKQGSTTAGSVPGTVGITVNSSEIPKVFALGQNYPNPFNPVTLINFDVPKRSNVKLRVFDVTGRLVQVLTDELSEAGKYTAEFDATNLSSGIYYYEITAKAEEGGGIFTDVKKMILIK
jgi:predicted TIM-barrel fold metal-dependent hydrolase